MDSSCIDCQQPFHHIKMASHPEILSIRDTFRRASLKNDTGSQIELPKIISELSTTEGIKENASVTLDDVEKANKVAVAVRGHFGERRHASGYRDGTNICV